MRKGNRNCLVFIMIAKNLVGGGSGYRVDLRSYLRFREPEAYFFLASWMGLACFGDLCFV